MWDINLQKHMLIHAGINPLLHDSAFLHLEIHYVSENVIENGAFAPLFEQMLHFSKKFQKY